MKKARHRYMSLTRCNVSGGATRFGGDVPSLLNGDHLTVPEFERRYEAMAGDRKAELIEGVVVLGSSVTVDHGQRHAQIASFISCFRRGIDGLAAGICPSLRLDGGNEFHPDVILRLNEGGRSRVGEDGLLEGAPELVIELAMSRVGYEQHEKKGVYERCGVREYLVWEIMDAQFHWFHLENGAYLKLESQSGVLKSRIFPGLWIDATYLLAGEEIKALRTLERGLKSAGHKTFVKNLRKSA